MFGAKSLEEKINDFSISTAAELLKQMGYTAGQVKAFQSHVGPAFDLQWAVDLLGINQQVRATRISSYNFEQIFHMKSKHALVKEYQRLITEPAGHLIVRAYSLGRIVISSEPRQRGETTPVISLVVDQQPLYVHHFKNFFRTCYPNLGVDDGQQID